ncbi:MAG: hypothetical protein JJT81_09505 [Rubellimicrobium sp.]|nr:hypothetical protein [Rubellimicrobium sp.]
MAAAGPLRAEEVPAEIEQLFDVLALGEMLEIMREEGIGYGEQIAQDLFMGPVTDRLAREWDGIVAEIYDLDRMQAEVKASLARVLDGRDVGPMIDFFTALPGSEVIRLEVTARRALLDDELMEIAKENAAIAIADSLPRYELIRRFIEANDLIELNVVGALNSNLAFFVGMMDAAPGPGGFSSDDLLAEVWSREGEIRANTTEWIYAFLLTAYHPLSDADIEAYLAFAETEQGSLLNRAVFVAFDGMFETISLALGQASSRFMLGMEL